MNGLETWTGFLIYCAVSGITPGPNNLLSLANATNFGFRACIPMLLGLAASFVVLMASCGLATSAFAAMVPQAMPYLSAAGSAYILWLAWKILRSAAPGTRAATPCTFWQAVLVNCLNAKVMLGVTTALTAYIAPVTQQVSAMVAAALVFGAFCSASNVLWALAGNAFRSLFSRHRRLTNAVLALSLVYTVVAMHL